MIRLLSVLVLGIAVCAFCISARAADEKEVKLEGDICCGKCELKKSAECAVTIVVKKDGKETVYWLDDKTSKKYHPDVCQEVKKGTVTGTVKKDGDKMIITDSKLEYAK